MATKLSTTNIPRSPGSHENGSGQSGSASERGVSLVPGDQSPDVTEARDEGAEPSPADPIPRPLYFTDKIIMPANIRNFCVGSGREPYSKEIDHAEGKGFDFAGRGELPRLDAESGEKDFQRAVNRFFADRTSLHRIYAKVVKVDSHIDLYYAKHDKLGEGATAEAHEVYDVHLPTERLAMKVEARNVVGSSNILQKLYKELLVLNRILPKHENILRTKDVLISPNHVYTVTQMCEKGIDLRDFFPVARNINGRRVFKQIAETVRFMHQYGVSHMDLLPKNVMFADPNFMQVKIREFGCCGYNPELAQRKHEDFEPESWLSSQELAKMREEPKYDIDSLGKILFAILAGRSIVCGDVLIKQAYKSRAHFFPRSAHDLLKQIGPKPCRSQAFTMLSIEQVCQHPWISAGEVEASPPMKDISLETDSIPLRWLTTIGGKVTPKVLDFDFELANHFETLQSLQKTAVESTVFECVHPNNLAIKAAIRLIPRVEPQSTAGEDEAPKVPFSLYKEVIVLTKLLPKHDNVVDLKHVFVSKENIYVVTELYEKMTLADFIPFAFARQTFARRFLKQLAETVRWLHQYGVVHMDLHPRHIVFTDSIQLEHCQFKIIDFSKAAYIPELATNQDTVSQASRWFTPEALQMAAQGGKVEVDIRALGRILHAMMTGVWEPDTTNCASYKPNMASLGSSAGDLLSKIGPVPFGPEEGNPKLISMEEICRHPWLQMLPCSH